MTRIFEWESLSTSGVNDKDWDDFIATSDNGTIFHTRRFLSYHPAGRFPDASLVIRKSGKIFAVLPATVVEREGRKILSSHSGASYGGFAYNSALNLAESFELAAIAEEYARSLGCSRIQLTPPPAIYPSSVSNYIDFALTQHGFTYLKRELSSVVALTAQEDVMLARFRAEARTAASKSERLGIEIAECERFEEYYDILRNNLKMRHGVAPTHTLDELLALKRMFPAKVRLWGAFLGDRLIAGVCNFTANARVVLAFYISHNTEFQEYRAVNLLFREIMKRSAAEGFSWLDFGIFTVNMDPNWGLARFKENFGAKGIFRDTFVKDL